MTLTFAEKLSTPEVTGTSEVAADATLVDEAATVIPLNAPTFNPHFSFSESAENNGGEVAVNGHDLDETDGYVYSGPGGAVQVVASIVSGPGEIAPGATNTMTVALFKNNDIVGYAEEGVVSELDAAEPTWNINTYVPLVEGDVLHFAGVQFTDNEELDIEFDEGGTIQLY